VLLCRGALSGGELQESVSFSKIAPEHRLRSAGALLWALCCTCNAAGVCGLVAVVPEKDFLALCNSWSHLCSADVFKAEILNLPRK